MSKEKLDEDCDEIYNRLFGENYTVTFEEGLYNICDLNNMYSLSCDEKKIKQNKRRIEQFEREVKRMKLANKS